MANQVGELYVSLQVDIEALQQGFTQAQLFSQNAANQIQTAWVKGANTAATQAQKALTTAMKATAVQTNLTTQAARKAATGYSLLAAASDQTRKKEEQLNAAQKTVGVTISKGVAEINKQASALKSEGAAFQNASSQANRYKNSITAIATATRRASVGTVTKETQGYTSALQTATQAGDGFIQALNSTTTAIQEIEEGIGQYTERIEQAIEKSTEWFSQLEESGKASKTASEQALEFADSIDQTQGFITSVTDSVPTLAKSLQGMGGAAIGTVPKIAAVGAALNSAMGVIGLISMAVSALSALFANLGKASEEVEEIKEEQEKMAEELEESRKGYSQLNAEMLTQSVMANQLVGKLDQLAQKSEKTNAEKAELVNIVGQLNTLFPELNLIIDKNTWQLNKNTASIRQSTDAYLERIKQQMMEERLIEIYRQKYDIETDLVGVEDEIDNNLKALSITTYGRIQQEKDLAKLNLFENSLIRSIIYDTKQLIQVRDDGRNQVAGLEEEEKELTGTLVDITETQNLLSQAYMIGTGAITENTKATNERVAAGVVQAQLDNDALETIKNKIIYDKELTEAENARIESVKQKAEEGMALTKKEQELYEATTKAYLDAGGRRIAFDKEELEAMGVSQQEAQNILNARLADTQNIFGTIQEDAALTVDEMIRNLEKNQEAVASWSENLGTLADRGINQGLLDILESAGPEAAGSVKNLVHASDDELKALNKAFESGSKEAVDAMLRELGLPETTNAGSDMIDDVAEETKNNEKFKDAAVEQVELTKEAMKNQVSTSKFSEIGVNMIDDIVKGLNDEKEKLFLAARTIASGLKAAMRVQGTVSATTSGNTANIGVSWHDKGGYFDKAAIIGIAEKRPEFVGAAEDLETFIDRAIKDSIVKVNPAINYVIPEKSFPAAGGDSYYDNRVYLDVRPQQMTKEQTDYMINKVNRELGKKLK